MILKVVYKRQSIFFSLLVQNTFAAVRGAANKENNLFAHITPMRTTNQEGEKERKNMIINIRENACSIVWSSERGALSRN